MSRSNLGKLGGLVGTLTILLAGSAQAAGFCVDPGIHVRLTDRFQSASAVSGAMVNIGPAPTIDNGDGTYILTGPVADGTYKVKIFRNATYPKGQNVSVVVAGGIGCADLWYTHVAFELDTDTIAGQNPMSGGRVRVTNATTNIERKLNRVGTGTNVDQPTALGIADIWLLDGVYKFVFFASDSSTSGTFVGALDIPGSGSNHARAALGIASTESLTDPALLDVLRGIPTP
ncbi:MAG: hypothetical protein HYV07_31025 [Deltaproteobacteria bacterium]|nr:hypothetical protein [Deltaproteobacteria bacterium]